MKCPDCGAALSQLRMEGAHMVHRCGRCGGFFVDSWTVNRLTSHQVGQWHRINVDREWIGQGKGVCPLDGNKLTRYQGEAVPGNIHAIRCNRCGKWWFPGDSLFDYKPAQEAKVNYFKMWGLTADLATLILPILAMTILISGLAMGINLVRQGRTIKTTAREETRNFVAVYLGDGKMAVSFESDRKEAFIEYKIRNSQTWKMVVVSRQEKVSFVFLNDITEGELYEIRVMGRVFTAEAKRN